MIPIHPRQIPGRWRLGYALDLHTVSSTFLGHDDLGHPTFDTRRSEVGELLYRLKYSGDQSVVPEIAETAADFLRRWALPLDLVVAVPPSKPRSVQPVHLLATELGRRLGVPFSRDLVTRTRAVPELKGIFEYDDRMKALDGAHAVASGAVRGRRVLLFDDLYRSGATMNAVADTLYAQGGAADVLALTITATRSHR